MTRFSDDQLAFAASRSGYLDRAQSIEFLTSMDIRMSVGHWSAGDFCDRFAPPGYHSNEPGFRNDFEGQCRRTKAAGVDAIEIHQSVFEKTLNGDLDCAAIERARNGFLAELGMTVPACNINTWTHPKFRLGGPCNPDPALRRAALDEILKGVEICRTMTIPVLSPQHHRATAEGVGPMRKLIEMLSSADPAKLESFRREYEAIVADYLRDNTIQQHYLMTRATKA